MKIVKSVSYLMSDGLMVKSKNARKIWEGRSLSDSLKKYNLYMTRRGSFWVEHIHLDGIKKDFARWIDKADAAEWLQNEGFEVPEELQEFIEREGNQ